MVDLGVPAIAVEIVGRVGAVADEVALRDLGWDQGVFVVVRVAAGAARLLRLSARETGSVPTTERLDPEAPYQVEEVARCVSGGPWSGEALARREIEMRYFSASSNRAKGYRIKPYRLALAQGGMYLIGWVPAYDAFRTFALERVEKLSVSEQTFRRSRELPDDPFGFSMGVFFGKRAGQDTSEFFVSGRAVPWWLVGISLVATTFSTDTPNLVTNLVREKGVANNWQWWAFLLTGMTTVFFYARLWRRCGVLTDLEFYELRYSGRAASIVRGFRAVYLGLFFNCVIMATVNLAACKIAAISFKKDVTKLSCCAQ